MLICLMFRFRSLPGRFHPFTCLPLLNLVRFYKRMTTEAVIDKKIPDKWRDYKPCGVPIKGEKIIAFKTPLSKRYDNESDLDNGIKPFERFTPMDLLNHANQRGLKLGLVVDLTNTFRYYNGREFSERGILYCKIKCVGKEIPSGDVVTRFKTEVHSFLANNPTGALIGVHCTHGLNRTGYIVCRYLIECRGYTPEKAIEAFNDARGYPMERENYLQDLKTKTPKLEDHSRDKRKRRISQSDKPRFLHTSSESFTGRGTSGEDIDRMSSRPSKFNRSSRLQNEYLDFDSRCGGYRNRPRDYSTYSRDYASRRFSARERRDDNYRHYDYDNYDDECHNYGYSYRGNNSHGSRDNDYRPVRSWDGSRIRDHVIRNRPYSSRDRPKPYSRQTIR